MSFINQYGDPFKEGSVERLTKENGRCSRPQRVLLGVRGLSCLHQLNRRKKERFVTVDEAKMSLIAHGREVFEDLFTACTCGGGGQGGYRSAR
jgi:hypothetical protein